MTLLDLIKLGIVSTHAKAETMAEQLVERWHNRQIPGELRDVLGLTHREYQAWTTGGVSLLTIAQWHKTSHPPLDASKAWFRLRGEPGDETVGYLKDSGLSADRKNGVKTPRRGTKRVSR
jgi:hypothetical protein